MDNDNDIWGALDELFKKKFSKMFRERNSTPEEFMAGSEFSKTEEKGIDENGNNFTRTTYISKDGKKKFTKTHYSCYSSFPGKSKSEKEYKKYQDELSILKDQLKDAVDSEDYELAAKIRNAISRLKKSV